MNTKSAAALAFALFGASNLFSAITADSIAVVGVNSGNVNQDIALVTLEPLAAGETIFLSDNPWSGSSFANTNEGTITYTVGENLDEGTVVVLRPDYDGDTGTDNSVVVSGDASGTLGTTPNYGIPLTSGDFFTTPTSGRNYDQLLVYQAGNDFLYGVNLGGPTGWTYDSNNAATRSDMPAALVDGESAITRSSGFSGASWQYTGGTTFSSPAAAFTAIADSTNWNFNSSATYDHTTISDFVVPEPSTYALFFGSLVFGFLAWKRRRVN